MCAEVATIEDVEADLQLHAELFLEQEVFIDLVLVKKHVPGWPNRDAGPENKTQPVFQIKSEPGVEGGVLREVENKVITSSVEFIFES